MEIVHELQELDIIFKAVQQPFDLSTPEGKLLFHLVSSLGEFYSDNLSKETNKGKLERSLQGFHNGAVPWGYISELQGNRKVGVPDPVKAPIVVELFERYATGLYSDFQMADWINGLGYLTAKNRLFNKDSIRDMLRNAYYVGKIRYRGMTVRPKGVSYRSTPPKFSEGHHHPSSHKSYGIAARQYGTAGEFTVKTDQKTARVTPAPKPGSLRSLWQAAAHPNAQRTFRPITGRIRTCADITIARTQVKAFKPMSWMSKLPLL